VRGASILPELGTRYRNLHYNFIMTFANNLFASALLAPLVTVLGAVSLATLQRSIEWVSFIANNPQK
jgi:hypothetical protein